MDHETFVWLARSRSWLAEHFDEQVRLEMAAQEACMSPFHYHRLFVQAFGQTQHDFLTDRRLDRARMLLTHTELPVTEVCLEAGYSSLGTFSTRFRRIYGCSPTEYREGAKRFWQVAGFRSHRFIPTCFICRRRS